MCRYNRIIKNALFTELTEKIRQREKDRIFCRHSIEHSLDVARIAYILVLENNIAIDKDMIYAAALLHDIGRAYSDGNHRQDSVVPAEKILSACGYSIAEIYEITSAILSHGSAPSELNTLSDVIGRADKLSRCCFDCEANAECYWQEENRNKDITY